MVAALGLSAPPPLPNLVPATLDLSVFYVGVGDLGSLLGSSSEPLICCLASITVSTVHWLAALSTCAWYLSLFDQRNGLHGMTESELSSFASGRGS